jgi:alpha-N-arabinofuranosidase
MPWETGWGCGGSMTPAYYADQFRRYATYVRNFGDNHIFRIACGPNDADYKWTEELMNHARWQMVGLAQERSTSRSATVSG